MSMQESSHETSAGFDLELIGDDDHLFAIYSGAASMSDHFYGYVIGEKRASRLVSELNARGHFFGEVFHCTHLHHITSIDDKVFSEYLLPENLT